LGFAAIYCSSDTVLNVRLRSDPISVLTRPQRPHFIFASTISRLKTSTLRPQDLLQITRRLLHTTPSLDGLYPAYRPPQPRRISLQMT
jgi:hypothetical protein